MFRVVSFALLIVLLAAAVAPTLAQDPVLDPLVQSKLDALFCPGVPQFAYYWGQRDYDSGYRCIEPTGHGLEVEVKYLDFVHAFLLFLISPGGEPTVFEKYGQRYIIYAISNGDPLASGFVWGSEPVSWELLWNYYPNDVLEYRGRIDRWWFNLSFPAARS